MMLCIEMSSYIMTLDAFLHVKTILKVPTNKIWLIIFNWKSYNVQYYIHV